MLTFDVNWIAIAVLVIANMALGAIWYGPLFGKPWMEATGIKMDDMEGKNMMPPLRCRHHEFIFHGIFHGQRDCLDKYCKFRGRTPPGTLHVVGLYRLIVWSESRL